MQESTFNTIELPKDGAVDLNSFKRILDEKLSTSYKIFWFFGIYSEIINGNKEISFRRLVCRMIASAWYPVTQYRLHLGVQDRLYDLVIHIHKTYNIAPDVREKELLEILDVLDNKEIEKQIANLYGYVPYRLLSPFFSKEMSEERSDFGKNGNKKNKRIEELTKECERALYKIDTKNKMIEINDSWYRYIYRNQCLIKGWMYYKLICYLQKKNPNVPAIPFKIEAPMKRELKEARKLWIEICRDKAVKDIYTGEILTGNNFSQYGELSVDHFIPWSFVLHDELWNLAPTFKNINSKKNNKLPRLDLYMDKFCDIQYSSFDIMQRNSRRYRKNLEEYLSINIISGGDRKIEKEDFVRSLKSNVEPLYQIAYNQGYDVWNRGVEEEVVCKEIFSISRQKTV